VSEGYLETSKKGGCLGPIWAFAPHEREERDNGVSLQILNFHCKLKKQRFTMFVGFMVQAHTMGFTNHSTQFGKP
jgi:hypothetical protein